MSLPPLLLEPVHLSDSPTRSQRTPKANEALPANGVRAPRRGSERLGGSSMFQRGRNQEVLSEEATFELRATHPWKDLEGSSGQRRREPV